MEPHFKYLTSYLFPFFYSNKLNKDYLHLCLDFLYTEFHVESIGSDGGVSLWKKNRKYSKYRKTREYRKTVMTTYASAKMSSCLTLFSLIFDESPQDGH